MRGALAALASVLVGTPAMAETTPITPTMVRNPNEMVCEKHSVLGSRIQTKRVCMTRGQWADRRSQDRQEIEKAQTAIPVR